MSRSGLRVHKTGYIYLDERIMATLYPIRESFRQNPTTAVQQLLATGNAQLTHTQDGGDEKVNKSDRAITNRYSALDYHTNTLEKIKEQRENEKNNREYIELDKNDYLGNHILSGNNNSNNSTSGKRSVQRRTLEGTTRVDRSGGLTSQKVINDFLNEFGITVNHLDDYDGDLPLFDALNRVINAKTASDITDGVGYATAFMMQSNPKMQHIVPQTRRRLRQ